MEQLGYRRIGIIGALDKEVQAIFESLDGAERVREDGLEVAVGAYGGLEVAATVAGMGTVNAAAATQALICRHNVDAVIFSGIAGGLNPALHIADVVVGKTLRYLDTDTALVAESAPGLEEFSSTPELVALASEVLEKRGFRDASKAEADVAPASACDAPAEAGGDRTGSGTVQDAPRQYLVGIIATGDRFVADAAAKDAAVSATCADCVEMEGAAIAHVAAKCGVGCLIMRAISDNCDEAYDALSERQFDLEAYARSASAIVLDILRAIDA